MTKANDNVIKQQRVVWKQLLHVQKHLLEGMRNCYYGVHKRQKVVEV